VVVVAVASPQVAMPTESVVQQGLLGQPVLPALSGAESQSVE
jgi:hypothetical protein